MQDYEAQVKIYKALAHPTRLAILDLLRDGEHCVCHLEAYLGLRQAYISQQLMILREAGLVQDRRDGWNIFYRVVRSEVYALLDQAQALQGSSTARSQDSTSLEAVDCSCPNCQKPLKIERLSFNVQN